MVVVSLGVGCGPLDQEELAQQSQPTKATPILMGAGCPAVETCGEDFSNCTEWSAPSNCNAPSSCTVFQSQLCFSSRGAPCINMQLSPSTAASCN